MERIPTSEAALIESQQQTLGDGHALGSQKALCRFSQVTPRGREGAGPTQAFHPTGAWMRQAVSASTNPTPASPGAQLSHMSRAK
jgi:hypothetical protein